MRKGYDARFLFNDDQLIGICLGADFTSEHEWGIKGLVRLFGVDSESEPGLARTTIHKIPDDSYTKFMYDEVKGALGVGNVLQRDGKYNTELAHTSDGLSTAWSDSDFGIRVDKTLGKPEYLKEIYNAFMNLDISFMFLPSFIEHEGRGGLCIMINSRFGPVYGDLLKKKHEEADDLKKADEATGIKEYLRKAGKQYFALSPRFTKEAGLRTAYPVIYWLNPLERQIHNYGWFTVENLMEWAENKGPVMKNFK